jgi:NitT/TauT family transport system permease protein
MAMKRFVSIAARWYSIPLLLLIWQVLATFVVNSRLLPGLGGVLSAFASDVANGVLPYHAGVTLGRALAGFSMAVVVGAVLAAAMSLSGLFGRMVEPVFFLGYPVPKIALFPVFAFVFGVGGSSKIAFTFLECLYPIVISTYLGILAIQQKLIWSARNMGANRMTVALRVIVPAALPSIFSGLRIALPLALTVVVVTEMIGDTEGIGYYITVWSTRFRYTNVYAGILTVGICGLFLDTLVVQSRRWLIPWQDEADGPSL